MNCPKCKKEIDYDSNFCKHCGNPIREKCQGCGKMEFVGNMVCETKLKKARNEQYKYTTEGLGYVKYFHSAHPRGLITESLFYASILIISMITFLFRNDFAPRADKIIVGSIIIMFIWVIICIVAHLVKRSLFKNKFNAKLKLLQDKFSTEFPHYAEIIKKAESADV